MKTTKNTKSKASPFTIEIEKALRRARLTARKTARMYGTPIYFWRDGKVVAEKP